MPALWAQMYRMKFGTGFGVFLLIAVPWLLVMCAFDGVDDEGKNFVYRYFIHDQFARLTSGVHTTTPGGTFTYFIEQGGYAIFPWVALVPGALGLLARIKLRSGKPEHQVAVIAAIWAALTFGVIGASATKFHHYVFPMLPGLAIMIGLFIDKLWSDGIRKHAGALMLGLPLFALVGKDLAANPKDFTDLFVYNYDRPYPFELVTKPIPLMATRSLQMGDLVALVLIGLGLYLVYEAFTDKERRVFSRAIAVLVLLCGGATVWIQIAQGRQSPTLMIGVAVILTALYVGYEASRAGGDPKDKEKEKKAAADEGWAGRAGNLWTVASILGVIGLVMAVQGLKMSLAQDQILPQLVQTMNIKTGMGFAFGVAGLLAALSALMQQRTMMFGTFWALAAGFAIWFNWFHWVDLTHHWTQRDQYWVYYKLRKPDEPITAFLMNWRGETFYSKNTVKQIKENNKLSQYAQLPGRKWAQVEHNRFGILKGAAGNEHTVTVVDKDLNNKFMLVSIE
jgi:4-amino-4-deoxy-L-arabinose transferase-like glycosyltransferase